MPRPPKASRPKTDASRDVLENAPVARAVTFASPGLTIGLRARKHRRAAVPPRVPVRPRPLTASAGPPAVGVLGCVATERRGDIRSRRRCKTSDARGVEEGDPFNVKVQNMVYTIDLGVPLSLPYIAMRHFACTEYNPRQFAHAIIHLRSPVVTVLLFSTGNGVCTGCKSPDDMMVALRAIRDMMHEAGVCTPVVHSCLRNVVGSANLGVALDLDVLAARLGEEASYEPELFPGLKYRPVTGEVTLLVFSSGKVVMTGCRDEQGLRTARWHAHRIVALATAPVLGHLGPATMSGAFDASVPFVHAHVKRRPKKKNGAVIKREMGD